MSKKKYDHTLADQDRPGRYQGDYFASLSFDPLYDGRKKWLVEVGVWFVRKYSAKGHAEGYEDKEYWAEPNSVLDAFESKRFRTSKQAIAYLLKVRAAADAVVIERRLADVSMGQRTVIA